MAHPPDVVKLKIPSQLIDNITYSRLFGHYGRPLPNNDASLRLEAIARGKDVLLLATAIRNKNIELAAVRRQQEN